MLNAAFGHLTFKGKGAELDDLGQLSTNLG